MTHETACSVILACQLLKAPLMWQGGGNKISLKSSIRNYLSKQKLMSKVRYMLTDQLSYSLILQKMNKIGCT
jgi:hypothetical protein